MITANIESFITCREELEPLFLQHWEELALNKDKVPLSPDWNRYKFLEDAGILSTIILRDSGKLIGYFVGFIMPHLHYSTSLTYIMDMLYIDPTSRGKNGGLLFMRTMEQEAKRRGVERIILNSKLHKDISPLFNYFGYIQIESIHSKWIGG